MMSCVFSLLYGPHTSQEGRVILERALITESDGFEDGE